MERPWRGQAVVGGRRVDVKFWPVSRLRWDGVCDVLLVFAAFLSSVFFGYQLGVFVVYPWTRSSASYSTVVFRPPLFSVLSISRIHVLS